MYKGGYKKSLTYFNIPENLHINPMLWLCLSLENLNLERDWSIYKKANKKINADNKNFTFIMGSVAICMSIDS